MKKTVVAGILAVASVFTLVGCSGSPAATDGCEKAYTQQKEISGGLRAVVTEENNSLAAYVGGDMTATELAGVLESLTTKLNDLNDQEDSIDTAACVGD